MVRTRRKTKAKAKAKGAPTCKVERALSSDMPLDENWTHRLVRFEGITPILFGKPASTMSPNPRQSSTLTGETDVRQIAKQHMHVDDNGDPCVPTEMLWACLKQAGRHFKHGKRQLSTAQKTILHFFVEITGAPLIRLVNGTRMLTEADMQVQMDTAFNQNKGGAMVTSHRARFDQWALIVPMSLNISSIGGLTLRDYQDIFRVAGTGYGLGSRRPVCGGNCGKFRFENWEEV